MKWLILRRLCQLSILGLFLLGPVAGIWILKGDLAGSRLFGFIPLSDPLTLLQTMIAGHLPSLTAIIGLVIVLGLYLVVGGRVFCSWVCPVNIITDTAGWLQKKTPLKTAGSTGPVLRYWGLGLVLLLAALSGAASPFHVEALAFRNGKAVSGPDLLRRLVTECLEEAPQLDAAALGGLVGLIRKTGSPADDSGDRAVISD